MLTAFVTLDGNRLTDNSTITIGDDTRPVPMRSKGGYGVAPLRILETIDEMGYWSPDYYKSQRLIEGGVLIDVMEKAGTASSAAPKDV